MSDVENQYSHFRSHSIHIVENCKVAKIDSKIQVVGKIIVHTLQSVGNIIVHTL